MEAAGFLQWRTVEKRTTPAKRQRSAPATRATTPQCQARVQPPPRRASGAKLSIAKASDAKPSIAKASGAKPSTIRGGGPCCIVCTASGRDGAPFSDEPLLPIMGKGQAGKPRPVEAWMHACCALRAPPAVEAPAQEWWTEREHDLGWPTLPATRLVSGSAGFEPFPMGFDEWVEAFALYQFQILLASERRFVDGFKPPYGASKPTASLWRGTDRGTIGYCRMASPLVERAAAEAAHISPGAALLWGALAYRTINRLSTFARWGAARELRSREGAASMSPRHDLLDGAPAELYRRACSGSSLLGRNGIRDKWAREWVDPWIGGTAAPMACEGELPLPSEIDAFADFIAAETRAGRTVMTGEHQVQSKDRVLRMLKKLAAGNAAGLMSLAERVCKAEGAADALNALQELDTVGAFVSWQVFSDLVEVHPVQPHGLTAAAVDDSRLGYALFGPGARKGALLCEGGTAARDVLRDDTDTDQRQTLERSQRIVSAMPAALERMGLWKEWVRLSGGRAYDLETAEHLLCGWYGKVPGMCRDALAQPAVLKARGREASAPTTSAGAHSVSTSVRGAQWAPNPCTDLELKDWRATLERAAVRFKRE